MSPRQAASGPEADERLGALLTNANAVRAIAGAVEGTIGPKGLDTLLVDRFGEVVITNDGMTILTRMDVNHPAAKMVISTAKAQEDEVGDGTTTATIMAGSLLSEGVAQATKGVPVSRLIDGIRMGISRAIQVIEEKAVRVDDVSEPLLRKVALIAGRQNEDIADLVTQAAVMVGKERLLDRRFKLSETIVAKEGAENRVLAGIIVDKKRLAEEMPESLSDARVLVIDDSLEPEEIEEEALATESGFQRYLALGEEFKSNLIKIVRMGINLVIVDKGISDIALEILSDAKVMVLARVSSAEVRRVCEHTGAKAIKRSGLKKPVEELGKYLGRASTVYEDPRLEHVMILGGHGKPAATILVGATTEEVREERERICTDAASSVQAAIRGGVVSGGGAMEIALSREVDKMRSSQKGMQAYGLVCVVEALKRPLSQILLNAGFNPLEKVGDVIARQTETGNDNLAVDCDTGDVADMWEIGVVDPAPVKTYALKAAQEIACAILRIDTIIKKRDESGRSQPNLDQVEETDF